MTSYSRGRQERHGTVSGTSFLHHLNCEVYREGETSHTAQGRYPPMQDYERESAFDMEATIVKHLEEAVREEMEEENGELQGVILEEEVGDLDEEEQERGTQDENPVDEGEKEEDAEEEDATKEESGESGEQVGADEGASEEGTEDVEEQDHNEESQSDEDKNGEIEKEQSEEEVKVNDPLTEEGKKTDKRDDQDVTGVTGKDSDGEIGPDPMEVTDASYILPALDSVASDTKDKDEVEQEKQDESLPVIAKSDSPNEGGKAKGKLKKKPHVNTAKEAIPVAVKQPAEDDAPTIASKSCSSPFNLSCYTFSNPYAVFVSLLLAIVALCCCLRACRKKKDDHRGQYAALADYDGIMFEDEFRDDFTAGSRGGDDDSIESSSYEQNGHIELGKCNGDGVLSLEEVNG